MSARGHAGGRDDRANWSCPGCESSDVFRDGGNIFECQSCGERVHEAVGDNADVLVELAQRKDMAGRIADRLLETGGLAK